MANGDSFDLNLTAQDAPSTSTRIVFAVTKHENDNKKEDHLYIQKIQELANEKLELFAHEQKEELREQVKETKYWMKSKKHPVQVVSNEVTERLKRFITNEMNGSEIKLVIQKQLFETDTTKIKNRLNMPIKQLETQEFLREDEKKYLETKEEPGIEVRLVGPSLIIYEKSMRLKAWDMQSTKNYVLKTNWYNFVKDNKDDLQIGTRIQVWSFRMNKQLCFAVACVDKPLDQAAGPSSR